MKTPSAVSVHPRACGEHATSNQIGNTGNGSSPRLRGTQRRLSCATGWRRFIPAPAGNTQKPPATRTRGAVHPRACGEHRDYRTCDAPQDGSSPRLRGTQRPQRGDRVGARFIPAPAGNTTPPTDDAMRQPVHPRACGEHAANRSQNGVICGSSPRLRGTPRRALAGTADRRFIPAPAGNTSRLVTQSRAWPVHPRACGEHRCSSPGFSACTGSSPRLRGTRWRAPRLSSLCRFIPAPAGNTSPTITTIGHRPVHPRACGEHPSNLLRMTGVIGSSPRLRGTRLRHARHFRRLRFIPAPAGNTLARSV